MSRSVLRDGVEQSGWSLRSRHTWFPGVWGLPPSPLLLEASWRHLPRASGSALTPSACQVARDLQGRGPSAAPLPLPAAARQSECSAHPSQWPQRQPFRLVMIGTPPAPKPARPPGSFVHSLVESSQQVVTVPTLPRRSLRLREVGTLAQVHITSKGSRSGCRGWTGEGPEDGQL